MSIDFLDMHEFGDDEYDDCCHRCSGEGGYHDCGEDICCCEDEDDPSEWVICEDCGGSGLV